MEKSNVIFKNSKEFMEGKKKNIFKVLLIPVVISLVSVIVNALYGSSMKTNIFLGLIMTVIFVASYLVRIIVDIITPFALINFINSAHTGKMLSAIDSYKIGWKRVMSVFLLQLARVGVVFVGFVAFIIPGIYIAFTLMLADYSYIVRKKGVIGSLVYSFHIMQGNIWNLIKKHIYAVLEMLIVGIPSIISLAVFVVSVVAATKQIAFIFLSLLGLAGFIYFGIKTIKVLLVLQNYMYEVFKIIEKTKGEISEKDLEESKNRLKNFVRKIILVAVIVVIVGISFAFSALSK
jgi:hypothetical protein